MPVLGHAAMIRPMLESLRSASPDVRPLFICSPDDEPANAEVFATDADFLVADWQPGPADFARKINWAFDQTSEPWVFQGAVDLRFGLNWDLHAINEAGRSKAGVVGTNDLGNPQVKRGHHSTHTLISRAYIERYGSGTIDNTGRVFSEVYDHQWTDNEFVQTAMARGEWAFSYRAHVEHLHPHWGKGEMDETYEKATRASREDQALYAERLRRLKPEGARRRARIRAQDSL